MIVGIIALAPALVVQPRWPSCVSCRAALNMCDATPATSGRTGLNGKPLPSLIDEIAEFPMAALKPSIWTEMEEAFAQAAGTLGEVSTQGLKEWRSTAVNGEIDVAAFGELLRDLESKDIIELSTGAAKGDPEVSFPEASDSEEDAFRLLHDVVAEEGSAPLSGLKDRLRNRQADFSEKRFGFGGFLQFCKAARTREIIEMEWDDEADDYMLTLPS